MSKEFFDKIGMIVAQQAIDRNQVATQARNVRLFQGRVVDQVYPIAKHYALELEQRGIRAELEKNALGLSFTMRWQDGGHWTLTLGPSHDATGLQFYSDFSKDDGSRTGTADASTYTGATWADELFEQRLQDAIEKYVFYADQHGGVR